MSRTKIPLVGGFFNTFPVYHRESVFLNRIGFQFFRIVFDRLTNLQMLLRSNSYLKSGIHLEENMLSEQLIQKFEKKVKDIDISENGSGHYPDKNGQPTFLRYSEEIEGDLKKQLLKEFQSNHTEIVDFLKCNKEFSPRIDILGLKKITNDEDFDIENVAHSDTFFNTIKGFIYLTDVNEKNGPYEYYVDSAKLTTTRLKHEYKLSLYQALLKTSHEKIPESYLIKKEGFKRVRVPSELLIAENKKSFVAKKNTFICTNNFGFHNRGKFEINQTRWIILINYRKASNSKFRNWLNS